MTASPRDATTRTRVLVVGGGVAGVSLVHALSARGIDTTLIDRGAVGAQGASAIPAALLNPYRGRTGRARTFDLEGLEATWRWVRQLETDGYASGVHDGGVMRVAASARQRDLWSRLEGPTRLSDSDFPAHVHAQYGGMLVAGGGWLEPQTWLAALAGSAVRAGAVIEEGVELLSVTGTDPVVAHTSNGVIEAREVVLCLGAYDAGSLRLPHLDPSPGLAVTLALETALPRSPPLAGSVGIVFAGRHTVVSGTAHSGDDADVERLRTAAAWFVPVLARATVVDVWRGVRARRPSGVPVVRRLRRGLTLFGGLGGRGFLCSSLLAERLADGLRRR